MPYTYMTKMSRDDALAIRAYLRTVPAVHNEVKSNQLPFPFNIRAGMAALSGDALYLHDENVARRRARHPRLSAHGAGRPQRGEVEPAAVPVQHPSRHGGVERDVLQRGCIPDRKSVV